MSDPLDRELGQAIKAGVNRSLGGWTFTAEMRQAVLDRIAEEAQPGAAPAPGRKPSPSPRRSSLWPLPWVAATAAVLFLTVNLWPETETRTGSRSGSASEEASLESAQNGAPASPGAAAESSQPAEAPAAADPSQGPEALAATDPSQGPEALAATDPSQAPEALAAIDPSQPPDAGSATGEAVPDEVSAKGFTTTALPEGTAPEPDQAGAPHGGSVRLRLVIGSVAFTSGQPGASPDGPVTMMSVTPTQLSLTPLSEGNMLVLNSLAVQVVDRSGAVVSEQPLAQGPAAVAAGPDGDAAVVSGARVDLYTSQGQPNGSFELDSAPSLVAVGRAGRTALADESGVVLYERTRPLLKLDGLRAESVAIAGDGTLAVLTRAGADRRLQLYGTDGSLLLDQALAGEGRGLAFLAGGQQIAAGGQVLDLSGRVLWQMPFPPAQVSALGDGSLVLAWNERRVSVMRSGDGVQLWVAESDGAAIRQAEGSTAGDLVAVVSEADGDAAVWVIDLSGAERYAERLERVPIDLAVEGDSLLLLTPSGLETRGLAKQPALGGE